MAGVVALLSAREAGAVASYARQTGLPCSSYRGLFSRGKFRCARPSPILSQWPGPVCDRYHRPAGRNECTI